MSNARSSTYFGTTTTFGDNLVDAQVPLTEDFSLKLGDNAGVTKFSILDSDGVEVAYINSDGLANFSGGGAAVDGVGAANQIAYWTDSNSIAGDSKFLFDSTTGGVAIGSDAVLGVASDILRLYDFSTSFSDPSTLNVFGINSHLKYSPSASVTSQVVSGLEFNFEIPSGSTNDILTYTAGAEFFWTNLGSGDVLNGFAISAYAEHRGTGAITSELGAVYFNSQCNSLGGITGTAFKDGNFGCAGITGSAQGTVKRDYTFYAETPSHVGTMDQHYGLYMEDQEFGTESWAIKTTGGKVEFNAPSGKNSLLYMSDDDVAHGITSIVPTNVYGAITSISPTQGGLGYVGITDADAIALSGFGYIGVTTPSNTTAAVQFKGGKKNGANLQDLGTGDVLFSLINNSLTSSPNLWVLGGGSIGIRTQFPTARFDISSSTSDSSASSLRVSDSGDGSAIFAVRNDKRIGLGTSTLNSTLEVASKVATSGTTKISTFTGASHTGITASTEVVWNDFAANQTHTWAAGAITTQRANLFRAETIAFASASTVTNAATLAIDNAPGAGSNATLTNAYSLWVQAGTTRFDAIVDITGVGASAAALKVAATSDTPTVAFTGGGNAPTTAPAGYLKINVGGSNCYIPFWS